MVLGFWNVVILWATKFSGKTFTSTPDMVCLISCWPGLIQWRVARVLFDALLVVECRFGVTVAPTFHALIFSSHTSLYIAFDSNLQPRSYIQLIAADFMIQQNLLLPRMSSSGPSIWRPWDHWRLFLPYGQHRIFIWMLLRSLKLFWSSWAVDWAVAGVAFLCPSIHHPFLFLFAWIIWLKSPFAIHQFDLLLQVIEPRWIQTQLIDPCSERRTSFQSCELLACYLSRLS